MDDTSYNDPPTSSWTRPLARLNVPKATVDRVAEPPLSPFAPVDLDDDALVASVLGLALDIADILLSSGEGAADVSAQAQSVAAAYGMASATVEVTHTSITIGVNRRRGRPPLSMMRVVDYRTIDMTRMTRINRLIDQIVRRRLTVDQATAKAEEIVRAPHPHSFTFAVFGWSLLGASIVVQLGGSPVAGLLSMVSTFLLMFVNRALDRRRLPFFFQQMAGGFIAAAWAILMWTTLNTVVDGLRPSQLVAAGIIVLLAGLTLVGAIEDAITGFPVTSAGRGVETLINTGGIMGGITIAVTVLGSLDLAPPVIDPAIFGLTPVWLMMIAAGFGAAGFAIASYATPKAIALGGLVGFLAMGIYSAISAANLGVVFASGLAATAAGLLGGVLARVFVLPPMVVTLSAIIPMLPGLSLYRGLAAVTDDQIPLGLSMLFQAIGIAVALAAGVVFGEWLTRSLRRTEASTPEWRPGLRRFFSDISERSKRGASNTIDQASSQLGRFVRQGKRQGPGHVG